jgi:hypothetical protein
VYIDDNLKSQPKKFEKNVASFKKRNSASVQLDVDGKHLVQPWEVDVKDLQPVILY